MQTVYVRLEDINTLKRPDITQSVHETTRQFKSIGLPEVLLDWPAGLLIDQLAILTGTKLYSINEPRQGFHVRHASVDQAAVESPDGVAHHILCFKGFELKLFGDESPLDRFPNMWVVVDNPAQQACKCLFGNPSQMWYFRQ